MNKNNSSLPSEFLERLGEMFGASLARDLDRTFVGRPTTFRVNTLKADRAAVLEDLKNAGFKAQQVLWYKDAFILTNKTKRELMELPLYLDGKIYLQSLASMVPPLVLNPAPGMKVLDMTAAPGSKTSQIAALMQRQGELHANDNNKIRFFKLKHNMDLLGVTDEVAGWDFTLTMQHGAAFGRNFANYFDAILLDAPCSAEARFIVGERETYGYWSERKVKEMAYKQRQLIFAAWSALKPGGTLVYSTCTFAPEENEVQIARLMERYRGAVKVEIIKMSELKKLPILTAWNKRPLPKELSAALRILPTKDIEGFFVAKITKNSEV